MKVDYISLALNDYKYHEYCPPVMVRLRSSVGLRQSNRVSAPGDRTDISRGINSIRDTRLFCFLLVHLTLCFFIYLPAKVFYHYFALIWKLQSSPTGSCFCCSVLPFPPVYPLTSPCMWRGPSVTSVWP